MSKYFPKKLIFLSNVVETKYCREMAFTCRKVGTNKSIIVWKKGLKLSKNVINDSFYFRTLNYVQLWKCSYFFKTYFLKPHPDSGQTRTRFERYKILSTWGLGPVVFWPCCLYIYITGTIAIGGENICWQ